MIHQGVLRGPVAYVPIRAEQEAQHQLVEPLALAVIGAAGDQRQLPGGEADHPIEVLPAGHYARLRAIVIEAIQLLLKRLHRADVLQGHGTCLSDAPTQALRPLLHQLLVGILAALTEDHPFATLRPEAAHQLLNAIHARSVHIRGDQDPHLIPEIELIHPVQEVGVAVRPARQAHHALEADGQHRQRIDLPLGDDHLQLAQAAVEVVGDQLRPLHHQEVLLPAAVFAIDQYTLLKVVEPHAVLFPARLRHKDQHLNHLHRPQHIEAQPTLLAEVVAHLLAELIGIARLRRRLGTGVGRRAAGQLLRLRLPLQILPRIHAPVRPAVVAVTAPIV